MWQGRDGVHHGRSLSCVNSKGQHPPPPPPRSAPATYRRRPRREVGDRVFVTSPTAVLIEFRDENLNVLQRKIDENPVIQVNVIVGWRSDVAKLRNKSHFNDLEWQEVDIFIGKRQATTLTIISSRRNNSF